MSDANRNWTEVCAAGAVAAGEAAVLDVVPPVAVFNIDGEFFATDDTCTHEDSSLADGYIDCSIVECAFHFAKFDIKTGAALTAPAHKPLRTYPVHVSDGTVYVDISLRED